MGDVANNPNAFLHLPALGGFKSDAETALKAADDLLTFISTYGNYIPGVGQYVGAVTELDKFVRGAIKLFEE